MLDRKEPRRVFGKGPCSIQTLFFSSSYFLFSTRLLKLSGKKKKKKIQSFMMTLKYENIKLKPS